MTFPINRAEIIEMLLGEWDTQRQEIRDCLDRHGVRQSDLAAAVGTDPGHLSRLLNGKKQPALEMRLRLEDALYILVYGEGGE